MNISMRFAVNLTLLCTEHQTLGQHLALLSLDMVEFPTLSRCHLKTYGWNRHVVLRIVQYELPPESYQDAFQSKKLLLIDCEMLSWRSYECYEPSSKRTNTRHW
ncbi:hypothetical protein F5146DRAFT_1067242 [Armillaria mellea]|nr:hypothetical protein F5146DRAFT_1067242 [Armillaria mellea]